MAEKTDTVCSLILEAARDGGYVVRPWAADNHYAGLVFAGTLQQCLEYMAKHFGAEAKTPNLRPPNLRPVT